VSREQPQPLVVLVVVVVVAAGFAWSYCSESCMGKKQQEKKM
jgi:hypothetical protein